MHISIPEYACSAEPGSGRIRTGEADTNRVFATSRSETLLECHEAQHLTVNLLTLLKQSVSISSTS